MILDKESYHKGFKNSEIKGNDISNIKNEDSQINNRSIDKFKDYLENKYNALSFLYKNVK